MASMAILLTMIIGQIDPNPRGRARRKLTLRMDDSHSSSTHFAESPDPNSPWPSAFPPRVPCTSVRSSLDPGPRRLYPQGKGNPFARWQNDLEGWGLEQVVPGRRQVEADEHVFQVRPVADLRDGGEPHPPRTPSRGLKRPWKGIGRERVQVHPDGHGALGDGEEGLLAGKGSGPLIVDLPHHLDVAFPGQASRRDPPHAAQQGGLPEADLGTLDHDRSGFVLAGEEHGGSF
jgi:hypothetical protein